MLTSDVIAVTRNAITANPIAMSVTLNIRRSIWRGKEQGSRASWTILLMSGNRAAPLRNVSVIITYDYGLNIDLLVYST